MSQTVQATSYTDFKNYFFQLPQEEQVGFFVWPSLASSSLTSEESELLKKYKPSGVVLFKRNLKELHESRQFIEEIKKISCGNNDEYRAKIFVSIDEEGGIVSRLPPPFMRGQSAVEFVNKQDFSGLKNQVLHQAFVAKGIGVNCFLAPVVDILTEKDNPAMYNRCFGTTPEQVIQFADVVFETLQQENILSCAKHFPGHGNTVTDTHRETAVSVVPRTILESREWQPFVHFIKKQIPFIMAAHVIAQEVDAQNPATLSHKILTEILRNELGFKGLVLSDDLRMNAIKHHYQDIKTNTQESSIVEQPQEAKQLQCDDTYLNKASVDSLLAGCDILLSCQSIEKEKVIFDALIKYMHEDKVFHNLLCEKAFNISLMRKTICL